MSKLSEPLSIPGAWTVREVMGHIPPHWYDARIVVNGFDSENEPVKRVCLEVNLSGRRVIVLSAKETKIKGQ